MIRDIERLAAARGLVFHIPDPFPQNSLFAARIATVGADRGWLPSFAKAVLHAEFADRVDISAPTALATILAGLGLDSKSVFDEAASEATKAKLRDATTEAMQLGLFGSPSFVTGDGEIFWGDDRLEQALAWATAKVNEH